ncbi:MAG: tetratricopeptide repeat protein [Chthoniobacterales bacterium]
MQLPRLQRQARLILVAGILLGILDVSRVAAQAPPPSDVAVLFQEGSTAFQAGNYQVAADKLQALLKTAQDTPQLEPIYFTLGAAYYNLGNFPGAIATLRTYLTKFPQSTRRAEVLQSIAQACMQGKQYAEAIASYKELENLPQYRDDALSAEAAAYKETGQTAEAIAALEKLIGKGVASQAAAVGAIQLASLYAAANDPAKATATLELVRSKLSLMDNVMRLNALAVELGDGFLEKEQPAEALTCYRFALPKPEVVRFQEQQVKDLQAKIDANVATMRAEVSKAVQLVGANNTLKAKLADAAKLVEEARNLPDFTPALYLRVARAFYLQGKKWESIVAYEEILRRYPTSAEHEPALFGATVCSAEVGRVQPSRKYCEEYLKTYPTNPNASTVGLLLGQTALQSGDAQAAETYFGRMLQDQPTSRYREEMIYLMGNTRMALGKFPEAAESYALYTKEFPTGAHTEEIIYRAAMAKLFAGKYEEALGLLQGYLAKYPQGNFVADVRYRINVCKYSASLYDEVVADSVAWGRQFKADPMLGEVLALKADSLAATNKNDEAIAEYVRSYQAATTDEVLNYSLFAAQKLMQKKGDWAGIGQLFQEFVTTHPEHPTVASALYWVGKAKAREGKVDEARTFTADTIKRFINDPKRDAVEQLLTQLAQLCLKKGTPVPVASPSASPASVADGATSPAYDPQAEMDRLLGTGSTPTAQARILFATAELARLRKKSAEEQTALQAIADRFQPADFSSVLLAQVGDCLLGKGRIDQAEPIFQRLMNDFPRSDYVDFAWNGLGEIAFQRKDYPKALTYFTDAIDKAGATTKLKDVTLGKAKTLLALNRLDEARKIFEQVASIRDWRGEATAFSVYSLGEIERQQNRLPEAIAFYQRVYVAYQRYLPWVAKSYLGSAECFEKLGKIQEATRTYQEMLRLEKLAAFPEIATARERLKALTPG